MHGNALVYGLLAGNYSRTAFGALGAHSILGVHPVAKKKVQEKK